jgi:heptosyltransferase I
MKILIIKLSSIGDIIHTFPAIIDATANVENITIDWLIDDNFKDVPELLNFSANLNNNIIPISLRDIKKNINFNNIKNFLIKLLNLKTAHYDLIIDAQGLLKSALIAKFIKKNSKIAGFNWGYCKESIASVFYDYKFNIEKQLHAVTRIRKLFAAALNYNIYDQEEYINFGLKQKKFFKLEELINKKIDNYIVFLHGTTWETKEWPIQYWQKLSELLNQNNIKIVVSFYNVKEQNLTKELALNNPNVTVVSDLNIMQIARMLANAMAVVAVDTGFAHLAGAIGVPTIGIFGPTCTHKSKITGKASVNLQSNYHCAPCLSRVCLEYKHKRSDIKQPCLKEITPEIVYSKLQIIKI